MASESAHSSSPDAMKLGLLDDSVGPAIRLLRNVLASRIVAAFEPFGLRTGTFSTMALIAANPGCSQSEIARHIGTDKSLVVAIVDDLERKGLAARRRSTQDRRRNVLTLTEQGRALMIELDRIGREIEMPIRNVLTPVEVDQLIRLTRRAVDGLMTEEPADSR